MCVSVFLTKNTKKFPCTILKKLLRLTSCALTVVVVTKRKVENFKKTPNFKLIRWRRW